jgi:predicted ribonuclease YlaK
MRSWPTPTSTSTSSGRTSRSGRRPSPPPAVAHQGGIVPVVILDELDSKKYTSRSRQLADRARKVLRALDPLIAKVIASDSGTEFQPGIMFEIVPNEGRHERSADADVEMLDQAVFRQQITRATVTIISDDTGMMARALLRGLRVERPPAKYRHRPPADGTAAS